jgi:predicted TIM-barrel fold metal-dependent hydrolase
LDRCVREWGMTGIKTHTAFQRHPADGPGFWRMYEYARSHRLPVVAHSLGDAATATKILEAFADVTFIMAHIGTAMPGYSPGTVIDLVTRFDNLYLDLACSLAYARDLESLVDAVGAKKLLYASDLCYQQATHQIGRILFADIGEEAKIQILGQNAARLLGIEAGNKRPGARPRCGRDGTRRHGSRNPR